MGLKEEKLATKSLKKFIEIAKKSNGNTYFENNYFVKGAVGKIDGYYFYPVEKHGEKILRVIKEFELDSMIISEGDIKTDYLRTIVKEHVWDVTFSKNGNVKEVLDLLHGQRSIHEVFLGLTSRENKETLEVSVKKYQKDIEKARNTYLKGSMCEEIEKLISSELKKKVSR